MLFSLVLAAAGANSDQNTINTLLKQNAGEICQLPDETFTITAPFSIPSNTELRGSTNTILEFAPNCKIPQNVPMIDLTNVNNINCLLYTSPSPRDGLLSRMPSS